ncbi:PRC and DUF2382 domain-containing protein [Corynebacterium sp. H128]|uniref:PRC and DUF2382 domain-containing protein n=1 Tax=Corynebacterium sp. H128 TaxID=3133427 RepID=UPI0030A1F9E0
MNNTKNIQDLFNATAYDNTGDKLGDVKEIFVDDKTGQPTFVEVGHGLFGLGSSLVPLRGHNFSGNDLKLAFAKDRIKDAPDMDVNNALTPADQEKIYRHYGLSDVKDVETYGGYNHSDRDRELHTEGYERDRAGVAGAGVNGADVDRDRRDLNAGDSDSLVRSEERLSVDKEKVNTGEARLRKYVVQDTETVEVPVTREEVRVERTPVNGTAREGGISNAGIGEEEASVTLHEERVSVNKETVPVEEVRLEKDVVRDTETVSEDVRKEKIDVDGVDVNKHGRDFK